MGNFFATPKDILLNIIRDDIIRDGHIFLKITNIKNTDYSYRTIDIIIYKNNKNQIFKIWFQLNGYTSFLNILDNYYIQYTENRNNLIIVL